MSRFNPSVAARKPGSNVYTALLFIALVALCVAAGMLWNHNTKEYGDHPQMSNAGALSKPFIVIKP